MTLQEAIEEVRNEPDFNYGLPLSQAIATILNAVADGALIPANQCYEVRDGYSVDSSEKVAAGVWYPCPLDLALTIRSADDVRRDAIEEAAVDADRRHRGDLPAHVKSVEGEAIRALLDTPHTRSADDVRREALEKIRSYAEGYANATNPNESELAKGYRLAMKDVVHSISRMINEQQIKEGSER